MKLVFRLTILIGILALISPIRQNIRPNPPPGTSSSRIRVTPPPINSSSSCTTPIPSKECECPTDDRGNYNKGYNIPRIFLKGVVAATDCIFRPVDLDFEVKRIDIGLGVEFNCKSVNDELKKFMITANGKTLIMYKAFASLKLSIQKGLKPNLINGVLYDDYFNISEFQIEFPYACKENIASEEALSKIQKNLIALKKLQIKYTKSTKELVFNALGKLFSNWNTITQLNLTSDLDKLIETLEKDRENQLALLPDAISAYEKALKEEKKQIKIVEDLKTNIQNINSQKILSKERERKLQIQYDNIVNGFSTPEKIKREELVEKINSAQRAITSYSELLSKFTSNLTNKLINDAVQNATLPKTKEEKSAILSNFVEEMTKISGNRYYIQ